VLLVIFCVGQGMLYIFLYAEHFFAEQREMIRMTPTAMSSCLAPTQVCSVQQLIDALHNVAEVGAAKRAQEEARRWKTNKQ